MSKSSLHVVVRLAVLFSLVLALSLTQALAAPITNQGSSASTRPITDVASGQVFIYNGGFFPSGETVTTFNWFSPLYAGNRDFTPLLFTESNGVFTVVAIGGAESVPGTDSAQSVAFGLQAGSNFTTGGNFTFGFFTGLADSSGGNSGISAGSVPHSSPVDAPPGVDPASTNDWVFTPSLGGVTVGLGTTFSIPTSNGTTGVINFTLNNPGSGGSNVDRTYSANADGILGVAEPGTFSLVTGAGLLLAGLFRYRYSRGRRS